MIRNTVKTVSTAEAFQIIIDFTTILKSFSQFFTIVKEEDIIMKQSKLLSKSLIWSLRKN